MVETYSNNVVKQKLSFVEKWIFVHSEVFCNKELMYTSWGFSFFTPQLSLSLFSREQRSSLLFIFFLFS